MCLSYLPVPRGPPFKTTQEGKGGVNAGAGNQMVNSSKEKKENTLYSGKKRQILMRSVP